MSTLADAPLSTLTDNLSDFLGLPRDLDLPELASVSLLRRRDDSGWQVNAQLGNCADDLTSYEQIRAWAATGSGKVEFGPINRGGIHGTWCKVSTVVSFVGVRVEVWAHVAGHFEPPQPEADQVAAAVPFDPDVLGRLVHAHDRSRGRACGAVAGITADPSSPRITCQRCVALAAEGRVAR